MTKRSKILMIVLLLLLILVFVSLLSTEKTADDKLAQFEEELVNPNNELSPLEEYNSSTLLLISIATKIENVLNTIFSIIINFIQKLIGNKLFIVKIL